jgi:hypothetical protein
MHKAWRKIIILAKLGKNLGVSLASGGVGIPLRSTEYYVQPVFWSGGLCNMRNLVAKSGVEKIMQTV